MKHLLLALAGLILTGPALAAQHDETRETPPAQPAPGTSGAAHAAASSAPRAGRSGARTGSHHVKPLPARTTQARLTPPPAPLDPQVERVSSWISATGDNRGLPYIIVDKPNATLLLFDGSGTLQAQVPVLLGIALGDHSSPGVGNKPLAEIGPAEKTTPAGRFLARFGLAAGKNKVLWVDYANSVALHPIPPGANAKERRRERLLSPASDDNRITFGCINVPAAFYGKNLRPLFLKEGGYVYVLPDEMPLDEVFPLLRAQPLPQAVK